MPELEYCNSPDHKSIFISKEDAKAELARLRKNRGAGMRGMVYRCTFGEHYHITGNKRPKKKHG